MLKYLKRVNPLKKCTPWDDLVAKDGPIARLMNDKNAKELGLVADEKTLAFLWYKHTGNYWDPEHSTITRRDVNQFHYGFNEFLKGISKKEGFIGSLFKLPKRIAEKMPGGSEFVDSVGETI